MDRDEDFSTYVGLRWPKLVRSARLLGCSTADAEDLVQSALIRCYKAWPRVVGSDRPDAYVYRVLVNELNTSRRRRWWGEQPRSDVLDHVEGPDHLGASEDRQLIASALASLPADQRTAVVLRYFADLTEQDTANALGVPVGTVKSRTSRALARLSEQFDEREPSFGEEMP
jgi:RNA polymerase sigma-70 factor (sigma-E family)